MVVSLETKFDSSVLPEDTSPYNKKHLFIHEKHLNGVILDNWSSTTLPVTSHHKTKILQLYKYSLKLCII